MKMKRMLRRIGTIAVAPGLTLAGIWTVTSKPAVAADMTIYKSPWCECCNAWVDHLQVKHEHGYLQCGASRAAGHDASTQHPDQKA